MPRVQVQKRINQYGGQATVTINDGLSISSAVYFYYSFSRYSSTLRVSYDERFSHFQQLFYHEDRMMQYFMQQWRHITGKNTKPKPKPKSQSNNDNNSSDGSGICYLLFFILIFPFMLMLILIAGILDGLLFLLIFDLCFGKCKDKKRTWCSYTLVRSATNWSSQMVVSICQFLSFCQCCCLMAFFTLPIGLSFVFIGFAFDLVAWVLTFFYCWGHCCKNGSFWQFSLGRLAWRNLKWCFYKLLKCQQVII